jgi:RNA polymerase sigma-70 factor (ECF subfamily)
LPTLSVSKEKVTKELDDTTLIKLYLETQRQSYFSKLYNRYVNKVYSKCLSLLKNEALAQDATQEIFLKIFLNIAGFGHHSRFSTWVYSVTYNYCIDYIRRQKKERDLFVDNDGEMEQGADIIDDISDAEMLEMNSAYLQTVLAKLPTDDKMILLMKYSDSLPIKDICTILNKTESAVKMKLKRAKQRAKEIYNQISK